MSVGSRSGQGEAHSSLHALSLIRACGCGTTLDVIKWGGKLLTIVKEAMKQVIKQKESSDERLKLELESAKADLISCQQQAQQSVNEQAARQQVTSRQEITRVL